jgi:hypothetical protein
MIDNESRAELVPRQKRFSLTLLLEITANFVRQGFIKLESHLPRSHRRPFSSGQAFFLKGKCTKRNVDVDAAGLMADQPNQRQA